MTPEEYTPVERRLAFLGIEWEKQEFETKFSFREKQLKMQSRSQIGVYNTVKTCSVTLLEI